MKRIREALLVAAIAAVIYAGARAALGYLHFVAAWGAGESDAARFEPGGHCPRPHKPEPAEQ